MKMEKRLKEFADQGRTQRLWVQYHRLVQLTKDFIRFERTSDFAGHLSVVCAMLPNFASAAHSQYAKGARLYLEVMDLMLPVGSDLHDLFHNHRLHTVRYNESEWAGIWTDLCIEQTLMRSVKSVGGLSGGRLRNEESAQKMWIAMLDHSSTVSKNLEEAVMKIQESGGNHPDTQPATVKRDMNCFRMILGWFNERVCFDQEPDVLMSFSTGLYSSSSEDKVNVERSSEVGTLMQVKLDGKSFCDKMETN